MTADRLADWMRGHPNSVDQLTAQNRSYIFFKVVEDTSESHMGPIGAAKVALTPGRSLAVDHTLHHYGTPIWVESPDDLLKDGKSFSRLMVAQDTGAAINGAQRADIFYGSGDEAGAIAGKVRDRGRLVVLLPIEDALALVDSNL